MGERKGVNKYYPPDYDPSKGGLNKWQGTHALRERAKKLHLGILIIRFEMPYNIWCEGCENHIGTGVRYNAEKKKVGMYYTTPIYEFRMKCHLCDNYIEIKTDPANLDYEITSGARRQERRWDPSENEQVAPEDKAVGRKMAVDAMFKKEHGAEDKSRASQLDTVMRDLEDFQESRWEDDFSANQLLRQRFRASENAIKAQERKDAAHNLNVPLLPPSEDDAKTAALIAITMRPSDSAAEKQQLMDSQSVFVKMKPKRLSRALKKDVAKQSIQNIVAAATENFDTFTNTIDKRLSAAVRRKKNTKICDNRINKIQSTSNFQSRAEVCDENDVAGATEGWPCSSKPRTCNSHSVQVNKIEHCGTINGADFGTNIPSLPSSASLFSSHSSKISDSNLSFSKSSTQLSSKSTKPNIPLPSITFAEGKELLNFITPSIKTNSSTSCNYSATIPNNQNCPSKTISTKEGTSAYDYASCGSEQLDANSNNIHDLDIPSGISARPNACGLLVDYSGSDSD